MTSQADNHFGLGPERQAARLFQGDTAMKRQVQIAGGSLLALTFALLISCSAPPTARPEKTKWTVAFITNTESEFWKLVRKGCEKADAEMTDVEVAFKIPFTGEAKDQNKLIREALERHADAIAVSPVDPVAQKKVLNEMAQRVPLITQDSDAPDSDRLFYLGANNRAAGRQAGELLKKALPNGGKVMVFVGKREVQNVQERFAGLKEALQGSKLEVLDLITDENDHTKAKDNVTQTLEQHPDIAGLVGLWSYNGPAILTAVKNAKKVGKVKIVCFDDEQETLDGIKEGAIYATVAQQPYEYGYQTVQVLSKLAKGDKSVIPADKMLFIPTIVVESKNLEAYRNKMNQLLGKS